MKTYFLKTITGFCVLSPDTEFITVLAKSKKKARKKAAKKTGDKIWRNKNYAVCKEID